MKRIKTLGIGLGLAFGMMTGLVVQGQSLSRQVLSPAGGAGSSGNVQLSWTVGQTAVTSASAGSITLTQGFEQPETMVSSRPAENSAEAGTKVVLYPNPAHQKAQLWMSFPASGQVSGSILDMQGREIAPLQAEAYHGESQTRPLPLEELSAGTYVLRLNYAPQGKAAAQTRHLKFRVVR